MQMAGALSMPGRTPATYLAGSDAGGVRSGVQMARELVRDSGVREALSVSRTYVSGVWARLNGLRASAAERLPLGMATPLSDAGAPAPATPLCATVTGRSGAGHRSVV